MDPATTAAGFAPGDPVRIVIGRITGATGLVVSRSGGPESTYLVRLDPPYTGAGTFRGVDLRAADEIPEPERTRT